MGIADKLTKEVLGWGTLGILIVIMSVVMLKFTYVSGVTAALNTTINAFITGIGEPQNWVIIVVVAVVGFAVVKLFTKKN